MSNLSLENKHVKICSECGKPAGKTDIARVLEENLGVVLVVTVALAFLALAIFLIIGAWHPEKSVQRAEFGEWFGGILGTLFAGLSALLLLAALFFQYRELTQSRLDLKASIDAQSSQATALTELVNATECSSKKQLTFQMYVQWMQHAPFKEVNQIWGVFRETGNRTPREWSKLDPEQQQQVKERMEMALKKSAPVLETWLAEGLDEPLARALFF